jgi:hypothetical protein
VCGLDPVERVLVRICVSVVSIVIEPTSRIAEMVDCAVTTSPACSGRE